jgi:hypothetical protein
MSRRSAGAIEEHRCDYRGGLLDPRGARQIGCQSGAHWIAEYLAEAISAEIVTQGADHVTQGVAVDAALTAARIAASPHRSVSPDCCAIGGDSGSGRNRCCRRW